MGETKKCTDLQNNEYDLGFIEPKWKLKVVNHFLRRIPPGFIPDNGN
jgi:hypothetical protein